MNSVCKCPVCGAEMEYTADLSGATIECSSCNTSFVPQDAANQQLPPDAAKCQSCGNIIKRKAKVCRFCKTRQVIYAQCNCPECGETFTIDYNDREKQFQCPICGLSVNPILLEEVVHCMQCECDFTIKASQLGRTLPCPYCKTMIPTTRKKLDLQIAAHELPPKTSPFASSCPRAQNVKLDVEPVKSTKKIKLAAWTTAVILLLGLLATVVVFVYKKPVPEPVVQQPQYSSAECFAKAESFYQNGDYANAVHWYQAAAEQGHAEAQNKLALCYGMGIGVERDYYEAAKWYLKAAEQGHIHAQNSIAWCYANGRGINQDHAEAAKWYRQAALAELPAAQNALGVCYSKGEGVPVDHIKAVIWYRKAIENGSVEAIRNLGVCYIEGKGVQKSPYHAVRMFRKAAAKNDPEAQYQMALCYEIGLGVGVNHFEAKKWYYRAAMRGHTEAMKWIRTRTGQGDTEAQSFLQKLETEDSDLQEP